MKLGEIKIEALKLMFTNYSFDLGIGDLQSLISNENYGSYIVNMSGAISRALDRIENACVLPMKSKTLDLSEMTIGRHVLKYDTSKIKDLFMIERITADYADGSYDGNVEFTFEGENVLLKNTYATYTIVYYPTVASISGVLDTDELNVPDKIARLIPYFIKGDLYQEEEPTLASDARNLFEASLDDMKNQTQSKQNYVKQVFRLN